MAYLVENFREARIWCKFLEALYVGRRRMKEILDKNIEKGCKKLIILLGREAWTAYWSQDSLITQDAPDHGRDGESECCLIYRRGTDLENWEAESVDVMSDNIQELEFLGLLTSMTW